MFGLMKRKGEVAHYINRLTESTVEMVNEFGKMGKQRAISRVETFSEELERLGVSPEKILSVRQRAEEVGKSNIYNYSAH